MQQMLVPRVRRFFVTLALEQFEQMQMLLEAYSKNEMSQNDH
ncbi:hypothetical protein [Paraburkholderia sp. HD33-4]|nr:hypothetical protein [Paraburkholderia sp. HD33-4]